MHKRQLIYHKPVRAAQVTKGLLVQQLGNINVYAIRCANPNYSWAQHLADANRTGTCQQQNLASGKAQWDFVVLQACPPLPCGLGRKYCAQPNNPALTLPRIACSHHSTVIDRRLLDAEY